MSIRTLKAANQFRGVEQLPITPAKPRIRNHRAHFQCGFVEFDVHNLSVSGNGEVVVDA
jgi:hypothetical protein